MQSLTFQASMLGADTIQQEKLRKIIVEVANPDRIYLVGGSFRTQTTEGIFAVSEPSRHYTSDYFLVILMKELSCQELFMWQDKIEQHCKVVMPLITMVLPTHIFEQWLQQGHPFACTIYHRAISLHDAGRVIFVASIRTLSWQESEEVAKSYHMGFDKASEFLAGAEFFCERKQYPMAAFMLHQSSEQALHTLLKIGTGYHCSTHSIDRLLRYGSLVSTQLADLFPIRLDSDKHLFGLLQRAYSDTRYKEVYQISKPEVLTLAKKVRRLLGILSDTGEAVLKRPIKAHHQ